MTKENQKIYFLALFMVICAVFLRVIGKLGVLSVHGGIIRSLLYITLYIGWGIFAYRRILQIQVRRYMLAVSSLCVFWFVIRSMKYYLVTNVIFVRYIWYFYYLPMLFIPLFAVFISMSLGKPENFRLSNWAMGLYIPTTLLLLLVLTNDFHQLVFAFSDGAIWDDKHFSYAIGYYFVFGWEVFCAVASFGIMLTKCRLAQRTKYLPILLLCCGRRIFRRLPRPLNRLRKTAVTFRKEIISVKKIWKQKRKSLPCRKKIRQPICCIRKRHSRLT